MKFLTLDDTTAENLSKELWVWEIYSLALIGQKIHPNMLWNLIQYIIYPDGIVVTWRNY